MLTSVCTTATRELSSTSGTVRAASRVGGAKGPNKQVRETNKAAGFDQGMCQSTFEGTPGSVRVHEPRLECVVLTIARAYTFALSTASMRVANAQARDVESKA